MVSSTKAREASNGYVADGERLKDFVVFLFDVEKIGNYKELWEKFQRHEELGEERRIRDSIFCQCEYEDQKRIQDVEIGWMCKGCNKPLRQNDHIWVG